MKKIAFYLSAFVAVCALSFSSCTKEEVDPVEDNPTVIEQADDLFQIIGTIKDGELTKTQYTESAGTYHFSWSNTSEEQDEIHLIVYKAGSQDKYRLYADHAASSTTFSGYTNIGDKTNGQTWMQTGYALYPVESGKNGSNQGIRRKDYLTYGYINSNPGDVTVTLSASYDLGVDPDMNTQLSCTPLIGNRVGDTNEYEFKTATGVLMITLENVPTTATGLRVTSPSADSPLSGTFELVSGSPEIAMAKKVTGGQSRTVNFSVSAAGTKTFYIPVPVGTIPLVDGKGLQIELLDGTDNPIFSRRYTKELVITRNTIIPVTLNTPDWKKLGAGKFIDNFLWGKIIAANNSYADKLDNDVPGYVPVVIEQNVANPSQYRMVNPYGAAKNQFGYTPRQVTTPDDYLTFSISNEGVVTFDTHVTGFTLDSRACNMELVDVGGTKNKLIAGTQDAPKVVNLSPKYKYVGEDSAYDKSGNWNMIQIIFPAAGTDYHASATAVSPLVNNISLTKAPGTSHTRLILSTENAVQMAYDGTLFSGGVEKAYYSASQSSLNWSNKVSSSGIWYLNWYVVNRQGDDFVYEQGSTKVYAITASDQALVCGTWGTTPSVTFALSDDSAKGSIVISRISSYDATYGVYGYTYPGTDNKQYLSFKSGQLFADHDSGLSNSYGAMDKLSYQGLTYNKSTWQEVTLWNIPSGGNLFYDDYIVLRPTNDSARSAGGVFEGYYPYDGTQPNGVNYIFDCYGLAKQ